EGFVEMPGKFMQDFPDLGLIPGPSISGRITDPTGKPVAGATVQAYRVEYRPLGRTMKFAKSTLTNDLGEYRLFWLPYGFYTVAAGNSKYLSEPWAESLRTSPNAPEPDLGFPLQFYPGVENPGDARLVRVKPTGSWTSETIASFALRERPRFNVKVRPVADPLPANVNLVFVPTGGDVCASRDYFIRANKDGTIDIRDVPVGIYQMVAMRGRDVISPLVPVAVNQDIDDLKLALVPPETIYGTVTFEGMPPQGTFQSFLGDIRVNLTRAGTIVSQVATTLADPRTLNFAIPGLGPGSYYPTIDLPPGAFVKEVRVRKIRRIGAGDGAWTCDAPPDGTYSYLDSHGHLMPLEIPAAVPGNASNDPLCLSMTVSFTGHLGGLAVACGWPGCGPLMAVLFPSSAWRRHDDGGITPPDRIQILSGPAVEFSGVPFDDYRLYAVEYRFADLIFMPDFKDWYTASAASLFYDGREPCGQGTRPAMLNSCVATSPPGEAIEQLLP
ncbi:MAG TPA: carboxypeptidase-like regulatory domain-containing protein, partial [Terriglobia bacterium]|nr:carboxypeptidase-like regulatory domain-containing protein [Terriglobia bacterium]